MPWHIAVLFLSFNVFMSSLYNCLQSVSNLSQLPACIPTPGNADDGLDSHSLFFCLCPVFLRLFIFKAGLWNQWALVCSTPFFDPVLTLKMSQAWCRLQLLSKIFQNCLSLLENNQRLFYFVVALRSQCDWSGTVHVGSVEALTCMAKWKEEGAVAVTLLECEWSRSIRR